MTTAVCFFRFFLFLLSNQSVLGIRLHEKLARAMLGRRGLAVGELTPGKAELRRCLPSVHRGLSQSENLDAGPDEPLEVTAGELRRDAGDATDDFLFQTLGPRGIAENDEPLAPAESGGISTMPRVSCLTYILVEREMTMSRSQGPRFPGTEKDGRNSRLATTA